VEEGALLLEDAWSAPAPGCRDFVEACRGRIHVQGKGACGMAWMDRAPRFITDLQRSPDFDRAADAGRARLQMSRAAPDIDSGAVACILDVFSEETRAPDEPLLRTITTLASQIGQFIERKRAEEALRFQKSLLESQSEAAIDGILVVSREGVMVSFNRRFGQIWDIPNEILQARTDERALQYVLDKVLRPEQFLARVRHLYDH